jgi:hypothetical protein
VAGVKVVTRIFAEASSVCENPDLFDVDKSRRGEDATKSAELGLTLGEPVSSVQKNLGD